MKYPRSPHDKVGGIVYFGRMVEKMRLMQAGELHSDLQANLGKGFDKTTTDFLGVSYDALRARVLGGLDDEAALEWCFTNGTHPSVDEIQIWNEYMRKRGWNDALTETLTRRKGESGLAARDEIQTMFQYIDADEGRL